MSARLQRSLRPGTTVADRSRARRDRLSPHVVERRRLGLGAVLLFSDYAISRRDMNQAVYCARRLTITVITSPSITIVRTGETWAQASGFALGW